MLDGALNHTEWGDRATALGQRYFPQADPQSRARDRQGTRGHGKPVSDLVPVLPRSTDEFHPGNVVATITSELPLPTRPRQQSDPLVIANCFNIALGSPR